MRLFLVCVCVCESNASSPFIYRRKQTNKRLTKGVCVCVCVLWKQVRRLGCRLFASLGQHLALLQSAQGELGRRALGDAVVATDAFEGPFADDVHRDPHPPVRQTFRFSVPCAEKKRKNNQVRKRSPIPSNEE